jgi:hypothetical protein
MDDRPSDPGRTSMPPTEPIDPTAPIRPQQGGTEPIPERIRHPIVVPQKESTIAGLPRALVIAAIVGLALAVLAGFLIGRSVGGGETTAAPERAGRRAACERALTLSLQVSALQDQAIANRTQALQALVLGDEGQVQELADGLTAVTAAIEGTRSQLTPAVERCRSGGAGGGGKGKGGGDGKERPGSSS